MTEATSYGGFISILGALVMGMLFIGELRNYMTVETSSKVVMDQQMGRDWVIEFNVTMAHIPCKYASVDLADFHGNVQQNITANIERWHVDENFEPYLQHVAHDDLEYEEVDHPDDGSESPSVDLTNEIWQEQLNQFPVAMVNFHAPWCMWCRRLAPVWEHAARQAKEKFGDEVLFAKVDCTDYNAVQICRKNRIMAFPTVRVYKNGKVNKFQEYDGARTIDALVNYAQHARWATDALYEAQKAEKAHQLEAAVGSPAAISGARAPGCRLNGHVIVGRAPGNMHITISRPGTSFVHEHINVSHLVHHFSFGDREIPHLNPKLRHGALHPEMKLHNVLNGKFSSLSGSLHVTNENVTQEHYMKVVRIEARREGDSEPRSMSYQYSVANAQFHDDSELPSAKFSFDLSPMQVMVVEYHRSFVHFVTSVCAIVGGVFTMIGVFDAIVHASVRSLEHKESLNKQS